jgi:hypothetical protein
MALAERRQVSQVLRSFLLILPQRSAANRRQRIAGLERDRPLTLAAPFGRLSPAYLEPAGPFCYSQYVKLKAGFILAA